MALQLTAMTISRRPLSQTRLGCEGTAFTLGGAATDISSYEECFQGPIVEVRIFSYRSQQRKDRPQDDAKDQIGPDDAQ